MSKKEPKIYPQIWEDISKWPIYKLSQDRRQFINDIDAFTLDRLVRSNKDLGKLIAKTIYLEQIRIKEEPGKVDPPNERIFWRRIRKKLVREGLDTDKEEASKINTEILSQIIHRYSEEIVGTFSINTFGFARKFLTVFFTRLLNTAASRNWRRIWNRGHRLEERIKVVGPVETIRTLMKKGTVVVVPTHSSNLDSILIGFAMDQIMGLPSFSYGAGLNLYNTGYTAYFMNRLGAYRVDRRKKNPIYLETLKAMSNLSMQRGVNTLFFPGGTRARSGRIEDRLKLGLLGTVVGAQRAICQDKEENAEKVFVVPVNLGYHFVLEAPFLIEQHLKREGKELYLKSKDAFHSKKKLLQFAWQLFSKENEIMLSFSQPLDVLGNPVDDEGNSYDKYGNKINIEDYFSDENGEIGEDWQRETQYTKLLADRIVECYFKDNMVLNSHLVAFAAFELLKRQNSDLDLYGILRLPEYEYVFPVDGLKYLVGNIKEILMDMQAKGAIKLSDEIYEDEEQIIRRGMVHMGTFHVRKPLRFTKKGQIVSDSFKTLYFYHNRLENYGIEQRITWKRFDLVEVEEYAEE